MHHTREMLISRVGSAPDLAHQLEVQGSFKGSLCGRYYMSKASECLLALLALLQADMVLAKCCMSVSNCMSHFVPLLL